MKIDFVRASESDADRLISVQNSAFADDLKKYGECPAYIEDREVMLNSIRNRIFYKILADGLIVGTVEVRKLTNKHYYLRVLSVHPDYQNKGIGSRALQFLFDTYPEVKSWTLITPKDNKRNCHFYEKAGFCGINEIVDSNVLTLVCYRKGGKLIRALAVNGSPNGNNGNTEVLIKAFLEGAHAAGAECETIYLKDKKIDPCIGCFSCWFKTPGVCVHKDDMPELLEKTVHSDILVCAVPLYFYTYSGIMKNYIDRLLPLAQPFFEIQNGLCVHPLRYKSVSPKSLVLISNSGFPEPKHFSGLKESVRCWWRGNNRSISGMVCCAGGGILRVPDFQNEIKWYIDAVRKAGCEVVEEGHISDETQSILDQPLIKDQKLFAKMSNDFFKSLGVDKIDS